MTDSLLSHSSDTILQEDLRLILVFKKVFSDLYQLQFSSNSSAYDIVLKHVFPMFLSNTLILKIHKSVAILWMLNIAMLDVMSLEP